MRRRQDSTSLGTLAFITAHSTRDGWKKVATYRDFLIGAEACAGRHGFGVENHWASDPELSGERLGAILEARGISGLLISTRADTERLPALPWEKFAVVRIGLSQRALPVSCAVNHQYHTVREAARQLALRGCQRIGLALTSWQNEASDENWLAGFLVSQASLPRAQQVPVHLEAKFTAQSIATWLKRARPDAVLAINPDILPWLTAGGLSRDRFALLDWHEQNADLSGMDQNNQMVGAAAVELLLSQIRRNERGLPAHPQTILIESSWREPSVADAPKE
jgi:LacI family transcriptional regulator